MNLLESLTDEQRAAVEAKGPRVHIAAGAGSGKTLTLAARLAWLIANDVDPRQICCLTFTRAAASEIRSRVEDALVCPVAPTVSTFHALVAREVASNGVRLANAYEDEQAVRSLYEGPMRRPKHKLPGIEALRAGIVEHEATSQAVDPEVGRMVELVRTRLENANLIPTWHLIPMALGIGLEGIRFEHVLVDEHQDLTPAEFDFATMLLADCGTLFTVGDDRQAIFGWRGARGIGAEPTHRLTKTFRFGDEIAEHANKIAEAFGGEAIVGSPEVPSEVLTFVGDWAPASIEPALRQELLDSTGAPWHREVLVLARTNRECELIVRMLGNAAEQARRDPRDPLCSEADCFREIWRRGGIVVSTVHSAKGKEADHVLFVRIEDPERTDEERRVDYVACTRARKLLTVLGVDLMGGARG